MLARDIEDRLAGEETLVVQEIDADARRRHERLKYLHLDDGGFRREFYQPPFNNLRPFDGQQRGDRRMTRVDDDRRGVAFVIALFIRVYVDILVRVVEAAAVAAHHPQVSGRADPAVRSP